MKKLFSKSWQEKMRAFSNRTCVDAFGIFSCGLGCFRIVDIDFQHNNIHRDGSRSFVAVWLKPIGGMATDHVGRVGYSGMRHNWHAIKLRDFLQNYEQV